MQWKQHFLKIIAKLSITLNNQKPTKNKWVKVFLIAYWKAMISHHFYCQVVFFLEDEGKDYFPFTIYMNLGSEPRINKQSCYVFRKSPTIHHQNYTTEAKRRSCNNQKLHTLKDKSFVSDINLPGYLFFLQINSLVFAHHITSRLNRKPNPPKIITTKLAPPINTYRPCHDLTLHDF